MAKIVTVAAYKGGRHDQRWRRVLVERTAAHQVVALLAQGDAAALDQALHRHLGLQPSKFSLRYARHQNLRGLENLSRSANARSTTLFPIHASGRAHDNGLPPVTNLLERLAAMDFAHRLAAVRKQRGMTQQTLADTVGVHVTQLRPPST